MNSIDNTFSNSEITVSFSPKCCINSGRCAQQLADVFRTSVIPWINLDGADSPQIINQIHKCPSGALQVLVHNKDVA